MAHSQTDGNGEIRLLYRRGALRAESEQAANSTDSSRAMEPVLVHDIPSQCLVKRLQVEDLRQEGNKHAIRAVRIGAKLIAAVVAVVIAATEALAKVLVVRVPVDVIAVIAEVRVLIGIRVSVVGTPAILAVCLSGPEAPRNRS